MPDWIIIVLVGAAMLLGLLAVFLPLIPDLLLIWVAALAYGLLAGWGQSGPWIFAGITLVGVVGLLSEIWMSGAGAKRAGASIWGILAGLAAGVVGLLFFPPLGMLIGLLLGTFLVEAIRLKDARGAVRATLGIGVGYGVSFLVRFVLGTLMMAGWVLWVVLR